MELVIKFVWEKETKGTHRYEEVPEEGKPPVLKNFYLSKALLNGQGAPKSFEMTLKSN